MSGTSADFRNLGSANLPSSSPSPSPRQSPKSPSTSPSDAESITVLSSAEPSLDHCKPVSAETMARAALSFGRSISQFHLQTHSTLVCDTFEQALKKDSPISMLPNYEISPSGDECGDFLVVDLGGSTLRVAVISIAPPGAPRESRISIIISKSWTVENTCKVVNRQFFEWIAAKISETLSSQSVVSTHAKITTGITWSFPLQSTSYNTASIFHMAKGYTVGADIVGCDLKQLLESTVYRTHGIRLDVQSIINDSLAVFSAAKFFDAHTMLAMVLGTGLNFCCQLRASPQIAPQKLLHEENYVLFNTETSLFGQSLVAPLATAYDCTIDARFGKKLDFMPHMEVDPATNTIFQPFELLASGRYLPEMARLAVVDAIGRKEVFANQIDFSSLDTCYQGFSGELLCFICQTEDDVLLASHLENSFGWAQGSVSLGDAAALRNLVSSIIRRSAFIVSVAIVAFVKLLARHNGPLQSRVIAIGYVGSVMEYFGNLRSWVLQFVNECADIEALGVQVKLQPVSESSLVGTAIAAASQCSRVK